LVATPLAQACRLALREACLCPKLGQNVKMRVRLHTTDKIKVGQTQKKMANSSEIYTEIIYT